MSSQTGNALVVSSMAGELLKEGVGAVILATNGLSMEVAREILRNGSELNDLTSFLYREFPVFCSRVEQVRRALHPVFQSEVKSRLKGGGWSFLYLPAWYRIETKDFVSMVRSDEAGIYPVRYEEIAGEWTSAVEVAIPPVGEDWIHVGLEFQSPHPIYDMSIRLEGLTKISAVNGTRFGLLNAPETFWLFKHGTKGKGADFTGLKIAIDPPVGDDRPWFVTMARSEHGVADSPIDNPTGLYQLGTSFSRRGRGLTLLKVLLPA